MKNFSQTARVGLFFILGLALVWVAFETLSNGKIFQDKGYTLIAGFESLKELKVGDEVRMAGVKIGSVEKTRLGKGRAEAVLQINPEVAVRKDSTATIVMAGLLGTNYIGIDIGTPDSPRLSDGNEVHTETTPDLNSIMSDIGNLGKKLDGALGSISTAINGDGKKPGLFQKLDTLVTNNSDNLTTTIANIKDVTAKLNTKEGTLGLLINDTSLHDQLLATVTEIKETAANARTMMADAETIIAKIKAGEGTIGTLVYDDTAATNLKATIQNIRDVSDKLAKGEGTIGKLLNDDSLYVGAQSTLKKANAALDTMGDSGPITAVGVVANSLF